MESSMSLRRRIESNESLVKTDGTGVKSAACESVSGNSYHTNGADEKTDIRGDRANIAVLLLLYVLQGIPLGLITAIPMLLQNRGASYKEQAKFSFAYWPFSLKLLWAPIVDSCYSRRFGRRKSWLVPCQYLIGLFMMLLSYFVDDLLGSESQEAELNVPLLTLIFFFLNFLAATQDIAVDGWALTMLRRCNVSYASTCNSVGQTAGYFLGYVAFIAFESKEFCNRYIRSAPRDYGMVTLPQFLQFWGACFLIATTLIAIFKSETNSATTTTADRHDDSVPTLNLYETYKIPINMAKMPPIQILASILLTVKITFAACDAVTSLKLIDAGVPKEKLALLVIPITPLQIILPLFIGRYVNGPKPMHLYIMSIPYRMLFGCLGTLIAYFTPYMIGDGSIPLYYYILVVVNYAFYQIFLYCMFVAIMAFFAKISDPTVGGTYMTFLNTLSNLGGNLANTLILWLVDELTWRNCKNTITDGDASHLENNHCANKVQMEECVNGGGECQIILDGYYVESIACVIYGIFWVIFMRKWIEYVQNLPNHSWMVSKLYNRTTKSD